MMKTRKLINAINRFNGKKLIVAGDIILDQYLIGRVDRISPEAPVPVLNVEYKSYKLGGAGNVASNISSLKGNARLFGVCNHLDEAGKILMDELHNNGIESCVEFDGRRPTTLKCRLVAQNHQLVRYDEESTDEISTYLQAAIIKKFNESIESVDGVVFADYDKGFFSRDLAQKLIEISTRHGKPVFVDPKPCNIDCFKGCFAVRPNLLESEKITGIKYRGEGDLEKMARKLSDITGSTYSLISCSEGGLFVYCEKRSMKIPTKAKQVIDVTGAGDTLIATLALGVVSGLSIYEAAELANHAAGIVVSKAGTATVCKEELIYDLKHDSKL